MRSPLRNVNIARRAASWGALSALVLLPALTSGCTGTRLSGDGAAAVDGLRTIVDPDQILAGGSATVTCEYVGIYRDYVLPTEFTVAWADGTPAEEGLTIDGDVITATKAGEYTVRCQSVGGGITDAQGATLTVMPGDPVAIAPYFDDNPIEVHSWTGVHCGAVDQYGNGVPVSGTVSADAPLVIQGDEITSDTVGSFPVTCTSAEYPDLPREPADLHVIPGPAVRVELKSSPDRLAYVTGQAVTLYWELQDEWGNVIPNAPGTLTAPSDPDVQVIDAERTSTGSPARAATPSR